MKFLFTALLVMMTIFTSFCSGLNKPDNILYSDLTGNVWVETDGNAMYDGEDGPNNVMIFLRDEATSQIVDTAITVNGVYSFPSVLPGTYFLNIPASEFTIGNPLNGMESCPGANDADDMIDDDDNGTAIGIIGVRTSSFTLTDADLGSNVIIDYIDFCFSMGCEQPNPYASISCSDISSTQIICDLQVLNGICSTMPENISSGTQPLNLCGEEDNEPDNISWIGFVAPEGNYQIHITTNNCISNPLGASGIQVGVYTDCTFEEQVYCSPDCITGTISIASTLFTPGDEYYLFIDGCNGNVCEYTIDISGSPFPLNVDPGKLCIINNGAIVCDSTGYCIGQDATFVASDIDFDGDYIWAVKTLSGGPFPGDTTLQTNTSDLNVTFPATGEYEVCIKSVSNSCDTWTGRECQKITITSFIDVTEDETFTDQLVCNEVSEFDVNQLNTEDPNGDGIFGWQSSFASFTVGLNQGIVYTPQCSYTQSFDLDVYPEPTPVNVTNSICGNELPLTIGNLTLTAEDFVNNQFTQDDIVIEGGAANGCDSIVNLTVEQLVINNGMISTDPCTENGFVAEFDFDVSTSTSLVYFSYDWRDPNGSPVPDVFNPFDKKDISIPNDGVEGIYTLTVTIDKNGASCIYVYSFEVLLNEFTPSTPILTGETEVCNGDLETYTATNGTTLPYIWIIPDGAIVTFTGAVDDNATIDWSNSNGGLLGVYSENNCGFSDTVYLNIEVEETPPVSFSISQDTACTDGSIVVNFEESQAGIDNYNWDFAGANIISSGNTQGPGPHQIQWDSEGSKTISLIVDADNGCPSEAFTRTITVFEPVETPVITCSSTYNDILFTWNTDSEISDYMVDVLTGQGGTITAPGQFVVEGLPPSTEVQIVLNAFPFNTFCDEVVSASLTCITNDCPSASIDVIPSETSVCNEPGVDLITFAANVDSPLSGTGTYSGPGIINANGVFDASVAGPGDHVITYTYQTPEGCAYQEVVVIEVNDVPTADFDTNGDEYCITESVNLTYTGTSAENYLWTFDGSGNNQIANPNVVYSTPGVKFISLVVDNNGCTSDEITKTIVIDDELSPIDVECTSAENAVILTWNPVENAESYVVSVAGGIEVSVFTTTYTVDGLNPGQTIKVDVTAVSDNACPSVETTIFCQSLSTATYDYDDKFTLLHPNPTMDRLYLDEKLSGSKYEIINTVGQSVLTGYYKNEIDVHLLNDGLYMIRIQYEDDFYISKFQKN